MSVCPPTVQLEIHRCPKRKKNRFMHLMRKNILCYNGNGSFQMIYQFWICSIRIPEMRPWFHGTYDSSGILGLLSVSAVLWIWQALNPPKQRHSWARVDRRIPLPWVLSLNVSVVQGIYQYLCYCLSQEQGVQIADA